jgi:ATP-dependent Clp protease ATP-binding subunit ClpA
VRLTDLFQPERRRPDRALDALDEACAHAHATTRYDAEAERIIRRLMELAAEARDGGAGRRARAANGAADSAAASQSPMDEGDDDPFASFARGGAAALQRLGAELDAMLSGTPAEERAEPRPAAPRPEAPAAERRPRAREIVELRAELHRRLMEQGAVVRGHDVARVVSQISGKHVTWVD